MKILVVFNHPAPYKVKLFNELTKYVNLDVIFELDKAKDRHYKFYSSNTKYKFNNIKLKFHPLGKENSWGNSLKKYIKEHHSEYDHIIMNGYSTFSEMSAIKYMSSHFIPFIFMINGGIIHHENKWKKGLKTRYISCASSYLCPNKKSSEYLVHYGADESKIVYYPYSSINETSIRQAPIDENTKKQICLKYHLPYGDIFINASQFIARKNNEQLIEVFKDRSENLMLIGDGPLRKKYLQLIKKYDCKNIKIVNFLDETHLKEVMGVVTGLISLSKEDIFGHTILEALASGTPVISSNRVVSALEAIQDGVNGFIVDLNNWEEINNAISNVSKLDFQTIVDSIKERTIENSALKIWEAIK